MINQPTVVYLMPSMGVGLTAGPAAMYYERQEQLARMRMLKQKLNQKKAMLEEARKMEQKAEKVDNSTQVFADLADMSPSREGIRNAIDINEGDVGQASPGLSLNILSSLFA